MDGVRCQDQESVEKSVVCRKMQDSFLWMGKKIKVQF